MNTNQKKIKNLKKTIKNKNVLLEEYIKLIETLKIENSVLIQKAKEQRDLIKKIKIEKNDLTEENTLLVMSLIRLLKSHKKFSTYLTEEKINKCVFF